MVKLQQFLILVSVWLAARIHLTVADTQPCFYAPKKQLDSSFVSCGDHGGRYGSCCMLGDFCLESGACGDPEYNMTYVAGCTDPTYENYARCPGATLPSRSTPVQGIGHACNDASWVYCTGEDQQGDRPSETKSDSCKCSSDMQTVIPYSSIDPTALLPSNTNSDLTWLTMEDNTIKYAGQSPIPTVNEAVSSQPTGSEIGSNNQASATQPHQTTDPVGDSDDLAGENRKVLGLSLGLSLGIGTFCGPIAGILLYKWWLKHRDERSIRSSNHAW